MSHSKHDDHQAATGRDTGHAHESDDTTLIWRWRMRLGKQLVRLGLRVCFGDRDRVELSINGQVIDG